MNTRRLICFLLGSWFAGSLLFFLIARHDAGSATATIESLPPQGAKIAQAIGPDNVQLLLKRHGLELSRFYRGNWEKTELALGAALFLLMLFGTGVRVIPLAAILVVIVATAAEHWLLTGRMLWYGRNLDFVVASLQSHDRDTLETLQKMYVWHEIVKLVLLGGITLRFLFGHGGRRRRAVDDVDSIDNADHAHIDR